MGQTWLLGGALTIPASTLLIVSVALLIVSVAVLVVAVPIMAIRGFMVAEDQSQFALDWTALVLRVAD